MTLVAGRDCVLGCDVSKWQGGINYGVFNLDFVFYKASGGDGGLYVDPKFKDNAAGFQTCEGPYHFASRAAYNARDEADFFCNTILSSAWADMPAAKKLPPVLDWEPTAYVGNSAAWCLAFLERVEERTGMHPIIYTAGWCAPNGPQTSALLAYDFWLAAYVSNPDGYPCPPWGTNWSIWQYSSTGSVSGVVGNCDSNAMRRDVFDRLTNYTTPKPQPPEPPDMSTLAKFPNNTAVYEYVKVESVSDVEPHEHPIDKYWVYVDDLDELEGRGVKVQLLGVGNDALDRLWEKHRKIGGGPLDGPATR